MTSLSRLIGFSAALAIGLALWSAGQAAPQALGLVSSNGGMELNCDGDGCRADFTTFCLQQDRASPDRGTPYRVGSGTIEVAGRTASGEAVVLDPKQSLFLASLRKHMALRVHVPKAVLEKHGLVSVSINVTDNVVLVPATIANDPNPHTEVEVAMLGQSMRQIGTAYVDGDQDRMVAARVLGNMINRLPERGKVAPQTRHRYWHDAMKQVGPDAAPQGIDRARGIYKLCRWLADRGTPNMRHCLETHHDDFIRYLNSKYWEQSKPVF